MDKSDKNLKKKFRNMTPKVKQIVFDYWDPLHVKDTPEAESEYDSYIIQIIGFILKNDPDGLFNFLCKTEFETMFGQEIPSTLTTESKNRYETIVNKLLNIS